MIEIPVYYKDEIKYSKIDDEDYSKVKDIKWLLNNNNYAFSRINTGAPSPATKLISMHQLIKGKSLNKKLVIDHINGNRLDNQKNNLRYLTKSQNAQNIHHNKEERGINFDKSRNKWQARFSRTFIGRYDTKEEALKAYDKYIIKKLGEDMLLNYTYTKEQIEEIKNENIIKIEKKLPIGVTFSNNKYISRISNNGVSEYLGSYDTIEDAEQSYLNKKNEINKEKELNIKNKEITYNKNKEAVIYVYNINKEITHEIIVDEDKWIELSNRRWTFDKSTGYVSASISNKTIKMHIYLKKYIKGEEKDCIDHINRNKLDNRINNLRFSTWSDNNKNVSY
jgi:hypothetical protein